MLTFTIQSSGAHTIEQPQSRGAQDRADPVQSIPASQQLSGPRTVQEAKEKARAEGREGLTKPADLVYK
jgi:hypothetical protein